MSRPIYAAALLIHIPRFLFPSKTLQRFLNLLWKRALMICPFPLLQLQVLPVPPHSSHCSYPVAPTLLPSTPRPLHVLPPLLCKSVPVSPAQSYSFIRAQMPFFQGQTALIPDTATPATDPCCQTMLPVIICLVSLREQEQDSLVGDCVSCRLHRLGRELAPQQLCWTSSVNTLCHPF